MFNAISIDYDSEAFRELKEAINRAEAAQGTLSLARSGDRVQLKVSREVWSSPLKPSGRTRAQRGRICDDPSCGCS